MVTPAPLALSVERCGRVEPFWVELGFVRWHGIAEPTRQMNIEYRRCQAPGVRTVSNGFVRYVCPEHAAPLRVSEETSR